eukprot:TRINITY_DN979_c0_g1_i1.p1 TRINITY_DN979_c0_g1~~TRINITY_DN979_c0_g1_i1.p1  ORF type:complete len:677 (-),score=102.91 TRINITY_DN979_c0_g1_i1:437-2323(-)
MPELVFAEVQADSALARGALEKFTQRSIILLVKDGEYRGIRRNDIVGDAEIYALLPPGGAAAPPVPKPLPSSTETLIADVFYLLPTLDKSFFPRRTVECSLPNMGPKLPLDKLVEYFQVALNEQPEKEGESADKHKRRLVVLNGCSGSGKTFLGRIAFNELLSHFKGARVKVEESENFFLQLGKFQFNQDDCLLVELSANFNGEHPGCTDESDLNAYFSDLNNILPACFLARLLGLSSSGDLLRLLKNHYSANVFGSINLDSLLDYIVSRARQIAGVPERTRVAIVFHVDEYHLLKPHDRAILATQQMHVAIKRYRHSRRHDSVVGFPIFTATQPLAFSITETTPHLLVLTPWTYSQAAALAKSYQPRIEHSLEDLQFRYALMDCGPVPRWVKLFLDILQFSEGQQSKAFGSERQPVVYIDRLRAKLLDLGVAHSLKFSHLLLSLMALGVRVHDPQQTISHISSFQSFPLPDLDRMREAGLITYHEDGRISLPLCILNVAQLEQPPFWTLLSSWFGSDGQLFEHMALNQTLLRINFAQKHLQVDSISVGNLFPGASMSPATASTLLRWRSQDFDSFLRQGAHVEQHKDGVKWDSQCPTSNEPMFQAYIHAKATQGYDARILLRNSANV